MKTFKSKFKDFCITLSKLYLSVLAGLFTHFLVLHLARFLGAPLILQYPCGAILGVLVGLSMMYLLIPGDDD